MNERTAAEFALLLSCLKMQRSANIMNEAANRMLLISYGVAVAAVVGSNGNAGQVFRYFSFGK